MGRSAVDSNELFIDELPVPAADRIGEEGRGFEYILHGMNAERMLIAAEAVGLGRAALRKAAAYASERVVFGRPIGQNQAIQHPLAKCWTELEAANLMAFKAAALYDRGAACAAEANAAKYLGGEAAFTACEAAVLAHGGMGYAKEFHVERYLREAMIARLAPVSPQMILNFIAEKVLGLPKSEHLARRCASAVSSRALVDHLEQRAQHFRHALARCRRHHQRRLLAGLLQLRGLRLDLLRRHARRPSSARRSPPCPSRPWPYASSSARTVL